MFGELQPWNVGDFSTLAAWENDQEDKIHQMMDCFEAGKWTYVTARDINEAMDLFGIDYPNLPQYLKDLIDEIDIV